MHGATDKMKMLLDELLELSRVDRTETAPSRVSLREILDGVLGDLAGVINERRVDIHLPDTDLMLYGDRLRLSQIWQNLIENAIKYSLDGTQPLIELGLQQENGETVFCVRDTGIGIDPQYHHKVFGIFEKLDPKSSGVGLGLPMIQRIVEKYGGTIWVESAGTGRGSCFRFTLPRAAIERTEERS
ncbi:MAG: HAMP domain-containing histidine kinase [Geobacteraceae bacterium]|nr:HAMP domain-containing histidine kinase [Geobacteraceae bacterium]